MEVDIRDTWKGTWMEKNHRFMECEIFKNWLEMREIFAQGRRIIEMNR
jgi:hypothetical protein